MPGPAGRYRLLAIGLVVLLTLSGCSAFSLAWNYAERVLVSRVDGWVALTPPQRTRLERRLEDWLDHIAVDRLPGYIAFLRDAGERARTPITATDTEWAYRRLRGLYGELVADAAEAWIGPALQDLSPRQRRHLRTRMRTENAAWRARYIDVSRRESQLALAARIIAAIERWTGPLDVHQTQFLNRGVRALPDTSLEWYHYRLRMQAGLLALLRADPPAPRPAAWIQGWWVDQRGLPPRDRARFDRFERELVDLLAEFAATLSPLQRASLSRRLRGLADDLDMIHRRIAGR